MCKNRKIQKNQFTFQLECKKLQSRILSFWIPKESKIKMKMKEENQSVYIILRETSEKLKQKEHTRKKMVLKILLIGSKKQKTHSNVKFNRKNMESLFWNGNNKKPLNLSINSGKPFLKN